MTTQQLQSFIEEMEARAKEFNAKGVNSSNLYFYGKTDEARFVIDRIKHIMESN